MREQSHLAPDDYQQRNSELFARRGDVAGDLERAESEARQRRLRRQLDDINAELVSCNLGLVRSYTRKFTRSMSAHDAEDIEAAGLEGLIEAISTYDPSRGSSFASWASDPIRRTVQKAERTAEFAHLSQGDFEQRAGIKNAEAILRAKTGAEPAHEEIAAATGSSSKQVERVLRAQRPKSLDEGTTSDGDRTPGTFAASSKTNSELLAHLQHREEAMRQIIDSGVLTDKELFVFFMRGGIEGSPRATFEEIGVFAGTSRNWAQRHANTGRDKLKELAALMPTDARDDTDEQ
jgi:RNA polymerase sigma factor (sigma-70 family)